MKERCVVIPAIKKNAVIPDQLVKKLAGVTLVQRAINTARGVLPGEDIVVLTDSQEISLICERAGVGFRRNKDLRFTSLDIVSEMRVLLDELAQEYEHCIILRASCPLLTWVDVEHAWKKYREADADSLVTCLLYTSQGRHQGRGPCERRNRRRPARHGCAAPGADRQYPY